MCTIKIFKKENWVYTCVQYEHKEIWKEIYKAISLWFFYEYMLHLSFKNINHKYISIDGKDIFNTYINTHGFV